MFGIRQSLCGSTMCIKMGKIAFVDPLDGRADTPQEPFQEVWGGEGKEKWGTKGTF